METRDHGIDYTGWTIEKARLALRSLASAVDALPDLLDTAEDEADLRRLLESDLVYAIWNTAKIIAVNAGKPEAATAEELGKLSGPDSVRHWLFRWGLDARNGLPDFGITASAALTLNEGPLTIDALAQLLRRADDDSGHHILWVDRAGGVHLTQLDHQLSPAAWGELNEISMRFRLETFARGNRYVGPDAANDARHVAHLVERLSTAWDEGEHGSVRD